MCADLADEVEAFGEHQLPDILKSMGRKVARLVGAVERKRGERSGRKGSYASDADLYSSLMGGLRAADRSDPGRQWPSAKRGGSGSGRGSGRGSGSDEVGKDVD